MLLGRTLSLYLSARFLRTILLVFATVFALVYTLDLVELMRRAADTEGATPGLMARLSLYRTPAIAEQVFPFSILFGSMVALLNLSRRLELVVARAAGISAWQFLQPAILVGLGLGLATAMLYNPLSAFLKDRAQQLESSVFSRRMKSVGPELWLQNRSVDGSAVIKADGGDSGEAARITGVSTFVFDRQGRFVERVEAPEAVLRDGYWEFRDATVFSTAEEPQLYGTYLLASNLDASQVRQTITPAESVPFWQLSQTIARREAAGLDATRYRLQYGTLIARPVLFVAMVLVAASFSLRFFRFGGVAKMIGGGVAAGFGLYVSTELMRDLGNAGIVSPAVAAWLPALVGSLLGTLALLYQEDG
jgi:lipopolysaccharide export system permease protein